MAIIARTIAPSATRIFSMLKSAVRMLYFYCGAKGPERMSSREVSMEETLKRVFLAGLDPFTVFARISSSPDGYGPLMCMILLVFAYAASSMAPFPKVFVYAARANSTGLRISVADGTIRVTEVNVTTGFRRIGPLGEEYYAAIYTLALGFGVGAWLSWALGVWIGLKIVEGPPVPSALLSGYIISYKFYEYIARAVVLTWYLKEISLIEIVVVKDTLKVGKLLTFISAALSSISGLQTALNALTIFFTIWGIVVATGAVSRGYAPLRKAVAGGLVAFFISSLAQSLVQYLLLISF